MEKQKKIWFLDGINIIGVKNKISMDTIKSNFIEAKKDADIKRIIKEGYSYLIVNGIVILANIVERYPPLVLATLTEGCAFGMTSEVSGVNQVLQCYTDCEIIGIPNDEFIRLVDSIGYRTEAKIGIFGKKKEIDVSMLVGLNIRSKILYVLERLRGENGNISRVPLKTIARLACMSEETAALGISRLKSIGLIDITDEGIILKE